MGGTAQNISSEIKAPDEVVNQYRNVFDAANTAASKPFQTYSENPADFVAQINAQQQLGISGVNAAANSYQPYYDQAMKAAMAGTGYATPGELNIDQFMNPYQQDVINSTMALMGQANEQAQSGALGTATSSGAFGGDRAGIAAANLSQQQNLAMGSTLAEMNAANYNQALAAAQQQQGVQLAADQANLDRQLQAAGVMGNLGTGYQAAGLAGGEAQINAGTLQQQTEQAGLTALYNQFLQEQAYPFQTAQFLADITGAIGPNFGSTTTQRELTGSARGGRIGKADGGITSGMPYSSMMQPMQNAGAYVPPTGYVPVGGLAPAQMMVPEISSAPGPDPMADISSMATSVKTLSERARGGRIGRADGGPAYLEQKPTGVAPAPVGYMDKVATEAPKDKPSMPTAPIQTGQSGSGLADILKIAATIATLKRGGRVGYADGGFPSQMDAQIAAEKAAEEARLREEADAIRRGSILPPDRLNFPSGLGVPPEPPPSRYGFGLFPIQTDESTGEASPEGVFLPDIPAENESRGDWLARTLHPAYSFATKTFPMAAGAVGARALSAVPEALSYGLAFAQQPGASDFMHGAASNIWDWANRTSREAETYRGANQPEPLTGQEALDYIRTTPDQAAALGEFLRRNAPENMDLEPAKTMEGGLRPSEYGTAMSQGVKAAGWMPEDAPRTSVMTPLGVAGRPDAPIGSMPAAPQTVRGRPDVPVGSMPAGPATMFNIPVGSLPARRPDPVVVGRPDVPVGDLSYVRPEEAWGVRGARNPHYTSGLLHPGQNLIPRAAAPAPRRPEGLGAAANAPAPSGPAFPSTGLRPAGLVAPAEQSAPAGEPTGLQTASMVDARGNLVGTDPRRSQSGVAGVDTHSLFVNGIIPIESNGRQFKDGQTLMSPKGAAGISQMLPSTGPEAAKLAGLPWDENRFYTDEKYNAALGDAYFSHLYDVFGDPLMAAAAYNGGQGRLASAIDRATAMGGSWLDYMLPETQDYVQKFAARVGVDAPSLTGTQGEQPGGLSGADLRAPANKPYEDRNFIGRLAYTEDGKLNPNFIMSILAGLGTAAVSPAKSKLGAFAQGLGSFANAYTGLQKQAADIGLTRAETAEARVRADVGRFFTVGPGSMPMFQPVNGPAVTLAEYRRNPQAYSTGDRALDAKLMQEADRLAASPAGSTPGAAADLPEGVRWTSASDDAVALANMHANTDAAMMNYTPNVAAVQDKVVGANQAASSAIAGKPTSNELAYTVANGIGDGQFGSVQGRSFMLDKVLSPLNAVLTTAGVSLDGLKDQNTRDQILKKIGTLNADNLTPEQQRAKAVFDQFVSVSPNLEMTDEAAATIAASLMLSQQMDIDRSNYYTTFQSRADAGFPPSDMDAGFAKDYGQLYQREKDDMTKLLLMADDEKSGPIVRDFLKEVNSGNMSQEDAQITLRYLLGDGVSPIFSRWFVKGM